jgi:predicted RecA/RadA family phage recombinase
MQARFVSGNPQFIDYTPVSAVSAGDVIVSNDLVLIAHTDIAANKKGAVANGT